MKKRILTAVILVPVLLAILFAAPKIVTAILVAALTALASYELLMGTGLVRNIRLVAYSSVAAFGVPIAVYFSGSGVWMHMLAFILFGLLFGEMMLSHIKVRFEKVCICLLAGLAVPYFLSSLVRIILMENGRYLILIPFIAAFLSDTGAYFIGCKYGRRKLAPVISPHKSVEGVAGGLIFAVVGMVLYTLILELAFQFRTNYLLAVVYGVLGTAAGVFGDLCFSVIKRQTGIKDYGNLFPGHGGVLDRFDSMIVVCPLIETLLILLPVVTRT